MRQTEHHTLAPTEADWLIAFGKAYKPNTIPQLVKLYGKPTFEYRRDADGDAILAAVFHTAGHPVRLPLPKEYGYGISAAAIAHEQARANAVIASRRRTERVEQVIVAVTMMFATLNLLKNEEKKNQPHAPAVRMTKVHASNTIPLEATDIAQAINIHEKNEAGTYP